MWEVHYDLFESWWQGGVMQGKKVSDFLKSFLPALHRTIALDDENIQVWLQCCVQYWCAHRRFTQETLAKTIGPISHSCTMFMTDSEITDLIGRFLPYVASPSQTTKRAACQSITTIAVSTYRPAHFHAVCSCVSFILQPRHHHH
jgi:hypothetical protein